MKRILPLIFSLSVLMFACKKEETQQQPEPQYTIVDLPFNIQAKSTILPNGNILILHNGLTCISQTGQIVWQKPVPVFQYIAQIVVGNDGSIYLCGGKYIADGNTDIYVVKFNVTGDLVWEKTFGGTSDDYCSGLVSLPDGNIIVSGTSNSFSLNDIYITKLAAEDGSALWGETIGNTEAVEIISVTPCADSGAVLLLGMQSFLGTRCIKIDSQGLLQWTHNLSLPNYAGAYFVKETANGEIVLCGRINESTNSNNTDMLVYKLNASGQILWTANKGLESSDEVGICINESNNGGLLAVGYTNSTDNIMNAMLVKLSATGEIQKTKYFGPTNHCAALTVFNNPIASGYVITGYIVTANDSLSLAIPSFFITRIDDNGNFIH